MLPEHDPLVLDRSRIRRSFERAATAYDTMAVLAREVSRRMIERLELVRLQPVSLLDAGCGTGAALSALRARYPDASAIGLDLAHGMTRQARQRARTEQSLLQRLVGRLGGDAGPAMVCGDFAALPFKTNGFDLVWSNLALHWSTALPASIAELNRVLNVEGLLVFSYCGPDTLSELRAAFAAVDPTPHVHRFADMHDVGDLLVAAGFADPVMDMERLTLTFTDANAMMAELRALGAANAALDRRRSLTGKRRWSRMLSELEGMRNVDGRLPATVEVVYGHAWKAARKTSADGRAIVRFERSRR